MTLLTSVGAPGLLAVTATLPTPMPRWMLKCPKCSHIFTHTKIELPVIEEARRDPFGILPRPIFASDGENHTCPGCKTESVFQRQQLFYREDTSDFVF